VSELSTWRPEPVVYDGNVFSVTTDGRPTLTPYDHNHAETVRDPENRTELEVIQGFTNNLALVRKYTEIYGLPGEQGADTMSLTDFARLGSPMSGEQFVAVEEPGQASYLNSITQDDQETFGLAA